MGTMRYLLVVLLLAGCSRVEYPAQQTAEASEPVASEPAGPEYEKYTVVTFYSANGAAINSWETTGDVQWRGGFLTFTYGQDSEGNDLEMSICGTWTTEDKTRIKSATKGD